MCKNIPSRGERRVKRRYAGHQRRGAGVALVAPRALPRRVHGLGMRDEPPELPRAARAATVQPAADIHRTAHARAVAHHQEILFVPRRPEGEFSRRRGVHVVFHSHRQAQLPLQDLPRVQPRVAGDIVAQADNARPGVHLAGGGDAHTLHARRLPHKLRHAGQHRPRPAASVRRRFLYVCQHAVLQHARLDVCPSDVDT